MRRLGLQLVVVFLLMGNIHPVAALQDKVAELRWDELNGRDPYIYTVPRVDKATVIDGVYIKKALRESTMVPCRRCPDWLANPGIWRLSFHRGVYRIINTHTQWKSIGTYLISKDRILLANDPACFDTIGVLSFRLNDGELSFDVVDDLCAIRLRGQNLSETPWSSCTPPNEEAGITDHWPKPEGCR